MARRRAARRKAVDILYEADVGGRSPVEVLEEQRELGEKVPGFTEALVRGVSEHQEELDAILAEYSEEWAVGRMAAVDRTLLRLAAFEILHRDDIPVAVAIDEAVEAAKRLSTDDSGRFVNGILGRIARERASTG